MIMRKPFLILTVLAAVALLGGSCTERRTASDPVPDGDTVYVTIRKDDPKKNGKAPRVIDIPDSIDLTPQN